METVTVKGQKYAVKATNTPASEDEAGRHLVAQQMRMSDIESQMYVTKPRGNQVFLVTNYGSGGSKVVKLDGFTW